MPLYYRVIFCLCVCSGYIPLLVYTLKFRRVKPHTHIIGATVMVSIFADAIGYNLMVHFHSNTVSNNIYNILKYVLFSWFYWKVLFRKSYRQVFFIGVILFVLSFLYINFFEQGFSASHQTWSWTIGNAVILVYGLVFIYDVVATMPTNDLLRYDLLWFTGALLFYFGFTLFIYFNWTINIKDLPTLAVLWSLKNIGWIVKNIIFAIGIYLSASADAGITNPAAR